MDIPVSNKTGLSDEKLREFCLALPKIDLHAHLSGCISRQTLHKIWLARKEAEPDFPLEDPLLAMKSEFDTNDGFFNQFSKYIYQLVNSVPSVRLAIEETLQNFEADGVVHFEVRTTPREFPANNMTKDLYISTLLSSISSFNTTSKSMKTHLLLSIDRRSSLSSALETAHLAIKYSSSGVLGVDLCGDSLLGDISIFTPVFKLIKEAGLKITLHFGEEKRCLENGELMTMLTWEPDRLGHLIFVSEDAREVIVGKKIPVEICLTSNIKGPHVQKYEDHHFLSWGSQAMAFCTDNVGVVQSPGSREWEIAARVAGWGISEMWEVAMRGVEATFLGEEEKRMLRGKMREWREGEGGVWFEGLERREVA